MLLSYADLSRSLNWAFLIKKKLFVVSPSSMASLLLSKYFYIFIFFLRTTGPISIKLGTKHPWVQGIKVCSNEGPCPFPRGDNYEIVKIHWRNLKIVFSRTTGPISTRIGTMHTWVKSIPVCSNEDQFDSHKV